MNINDKLIYDVGAHRGEDTEYYLKRGFDVVAIEAVPDYCNQMRTKFASAISTNRLRILNCAIADEDKSIPFYINDNLSEWSTANTAWVERNRQLIPGQSVRMIYISAEKLSGIFQKFGVPLFCKIDIEGNDLDAVRSMEELSVVPRYISIESEKTNWNALINELLLLRKLGYRKFKMVNQGLVHLQSTTGADRHGAFAAHDFPFGSSGLFGEEAPGRWMDLFECIEAYKEIFRGYFLNGDVGVFANRGNQLPAVDWYDTHASRDPL